MQSGVPLGCAAVCLGIVFAAGAHAEQATPVGIAARLLFKIATYDANLPAGEMRLGIAYPSQDKDVGPEVVRTFQSLESMRVNGRTIVIVPVSFHSVDEVASQVAKDNLYGLFVVSTTSPDMIAGLRQVAKDRHVFTFAHDPSWVEKGLTAGVREEDGKRKILLNITAATEENRKFDGAFIGACSVVH